MISKIQSACTLGVEAVSIDVEVTTKSGLPRFTVIGLGGGAIRESRDRILSALTNSGYSPPDQILVNLAPAELKKDSAGFDLAIALGVLVSQGLLDPQLVSRVLVVGELSLDGTLKPVRGVTAMAVESLRADRLLMVVPRQNLREAQIVSNLRVVGADSLMEVLDGLVHGFPTQVISDHDYGVAVESKSLDHVSGQQAAKRALLIAACGGHNLLMLGPPGCGKSMLAERLPLLLHPLSEQEQLDVVKIQSLMGMSVAETLSGIRPFRSPHHTTSDVGLFGGGQYLRPGEVTLAHRGVLFLDEFPEFRRSVLEALRTPLETRRVAIARASGNVIFPASFQLIAAMNPCPCGKISEGKGSCRCPQGVVSSYLARLSQPILDRIDLHVELSAVKLENLGDKVDVEYSQRRLLDLRKIADTFRLARSQSELNSLVGDERIREQFSESAKRLLISLGTKIGLSARGASRVLKVARTIADIAQSETVNDEHIAEALSYRRLERLSSYVGRSGHSPLSLAS